MEHAMWMGAGKFAEVILRRDMFDQAFAHGSILFNDLPEWIRSGPPKDRDEQWNREARAFLVGQLVPVKRRPGWGRVWPDVTVW